MAGGDLSDRGTPPIEAAFPRICRQGRAVALAALLIALPSSLRPAAAEGAAQRLPALCIDPSAISVSGISSGGYLAVQYQVAHSDRVMGAGIFAAGPYLCAGSSFPNSLFRALSVCSALSPGPFLGPPDAGRSIEAVRAAAATGRIDQPTGLQADRVFLFSGLKDTVVPTSVMDATETFYRAFVAPERMVYVKDVPAAHAMATPSFGNACAAFESPFINRCDYDLAGAALQQIYGPLSPPLPADGRFIVFEQTEFVDRSRTHGLAPSGYAYVPARCAAGERCRLHLALHGCRQGAEFIGDAFVRHAGYNGWAEANGIVVLYPQAAALTRRVAGMTIGGANPQGCWDWWGFTGDDFAYRTGAQISALDRMVDRLADCRE